MYNLTETLEFPGVLDLTERLDQIETPKMEVLRTVKASNKTKQALVLLLVEKEHHEAYSKMRNVTCSTLETVSEDLGINHRQPDIILISSSLGNEFGKCLSYLKTYARTKSVPMVLYSPAFSTLSRNIALKFGFDDYYFGELSRKFFKKIPFYKKLKLQRCSGSGRAQTRQWCSRRIDLLKRTIDVVLSSVILLILSPLLVAIALLVKLESRGPVFYVSKRAGFGCRIFDFYKFRSMCVDADKKVEVLRQHNQYGDSAFFKMRNDPRVTRIGRFLRCTSLDELPQLINVLKGDMSLVGNRPLPLYEAAYLTKEKTAGRFLAPAGITGLWQVTKRGKENVNEAERIMLDITYAKKWSMWYDLKILLMTVPALLQKEAV